MLQHRIASSIDYILSPHQLGFRKSRSTSTPVFLIRRLLEHFERHTTSLFLLFLDWQQAFDSVSREAVQTALVRYGLPEAIINPVMALWPSFKTANSLSRTGLSAPKHIPKIVGSAKAAHFLRTFSSFFFLLLWQMYPFNSKILMVIPLGSTQLRTLCSILNSQKTQLSCLAVTPPSTACFISSSSRLPNGACSSTLINANSFGCIRTMMFRFLLLSPRRVLVSVNIVGALIHCPILARWWTILPTLALFLMPLLPLLLTACAVSARPPQLSDPSSHFSPTNPSPLKGDCNYITRLFWQYCCTVLSHKHTLQPSSRDSTRCTSRFCVKYLASKVRIITGFLPPLQIVVPMLF